jgi:hypothetical protein
VGIENCDESHELIVRIGRRKANTVLYAALQSGARSALVLIAVCPSRRTSILFHPCLASDRRSNVCRASFR